MGALSWGAGLSSTHSISVGVAGRTHVKKWRHWGGSRKKRSNQGITCWGTVADEAPPDCETRVPSFNKCPIGYPSRCSGACIATVRPEEMGVCCEIGGPRTQTYTGGGEARTGQRNWACKRFGIPKRAPGATEERMGTEGEGSNLEAWCFVACVIRHLGWRLG